MMGDCLFECLKEAHLDRYYPNFVQRGLRNCESLVLLSMQDYPRYGVVSMEDRLHLFKLIQVIKSVQAEGVVCQHKNNHAQPKLNPAGSKQALVNGLLNYAAGNAFGGTSQGLFGGVQQSVPLQNAVTREVVVKQQAPLGFANGGLPQTSKEQPNAPVKPQARPLFREKPLFDFKAKKSPDVVFKKGSDSPIFKCRKTLTFTDSDLDSESEDEGAFLSKPQEKVTVNGTEQKVLPVASSLPVPNIPEDNRPESPVSKTTLARAKVKDVQSSPPRAFFVDVAPKPNPSKESSSMPTLSTYQMSAVQTNPHHQAPIIQSRETASEHAYFPSVPDREQKPVHIEKVVHGTGYNYGVPTNSSPSAEKMENGISNHLTVSDKIRVCVRKRPLTVKEAKRKDVDVVKAVDSKTISIDEPKLSVDLRRYIQQHQFTFDEVFDNTVSNEEMYSRAVKPLVKCVFNRGTATCFAFGQTGAGKTYTLLGTKTTPGMYRLAADDMFTEISAQPAVSDRQRQAVWVSYYEIYCGQLFDLLNKRNKLHVRENGKQKVCLAGLTETRAKDIKSLTQIIAYGNLARSTGTTGANAHSSRSHAVLQMEVRDHTDQRIGRLSFIDLAGSERASDVTDYNKQTRTEGAEINQSLLALKECIRSIDQDQRHTPYRQSKLTHILRDSFLGNSQTVMVANVAPTQAACENTLNTLRYADRVKELRKASNSKPSKNTPPPVVKPTIRPVLDPTETPVNRRTAALFHPSKIQYSSTPKQKTSPEDLAKGDLSQVLREAYDSPIGGFRFPSARPQQATPEIPEEKVEEVADVIVPESKEDVNNNKNHPTDKAFLQPNSDNNSGASTHSQESGIIKNSTNHKSAITLDRIIANVSHIMGRNAILNKEGGLSTNSGSSHRSHTDSPRNIPEHIQPHEKSSSSSSNLSFRTGQDIVQEHQDIIVHLDHVLDKAKTVIMKTTPQKQQQTVGRDGLSESTNSSLNSRNQSTELHFNRNTRPTQDQNIASGEINHVSQPPQSQHFNVETHRQEPTTRSNEAEQHRFDQLLDEVMRRDRSDSRGARSSSTEPGLTNSTDSGKLQQPLRSHLYHLQENNARSTGAMKSRSRPVQVRVVRHDRVSKKLFNGESSDEVEETAAPLPTIEPEDLRRDNSAEISRPMLRSDLDPEIITTGDKIFSSQDEEGRPGTPTVSAKASIKVSFGSKSSRESSLNGTDQVVEVTHQIPSGRLSDPVPQQPVLMDHGRAFTPNDNLSANHDRFIKALAESKLARQMLSEQLDNGDPKNDNAATKPQDDHHYGNSYPGLAKVQQEHGRPFNSLLGSPSNIRKPDEDASNRVGLNIVKNRPVAMSTVLRAELDKSKTKEEAPSEIKREGQSWADLLSQAGTTTVESCTQDSGVSSLGHSQHGRLSDSDNSASEMSKAAQNFGLHKDSAFTLIQTEPIRNIPQPSHGDLAKPLSSSQTSSSSTEVKQYSPQTSARLKAASADAGAAFAPIQPCPVTPRDGHVLTVPAIVTKTTVMTSSQEGQGHPMSKVTEPAPHGLVESPTEDQPQDLVNKDEEKNELGFTGEQSRLIAAHEDQLATVITLCKQEMKLLMTLRTTGMGFDQYLMEIEQMMCTKAQSVASLLSQIDELARVSDQSRQSPYD